LALHTLKLKHGFKRCTCRSCFHNSNGVLKTIAQGVRIEGGLCEFACAQQRDQSLVFVFDLKLKHGFNCCTCQLCFHNSNGALKTIAQAARIEGGLCEFARTTTNKTSRSGLALRTLKLTHGQSIAQGVRIEGGICEFSRAQQRDFTHARQQHQSLGFS
jgi:hypothetical protein